MSSPVLEALLKFFSDQGLTPAMLGRLTNEDLAELPGPDGTPLNRIQQALLKVHTRTPSIDSRPPSSATGTRTKVLLEEREAEIERLKKIAVTKVSVVEERDRLKVAAEKRKVRISEIVSYTRHMTTVSAAEVRRMVSELTSLGSNLDICFCIDGTGSMSGCIASVKQCIVKVASNISTSTGMAARFGLVVYRDYCDGANRHQVWDFGSSMNIEAQLATVVATGGGDGPEDCFGGIWAAITQVTWRAPAKVIVWMGDAPQHGLKYSGGSDDYPGGDPDGRTSVAIFEELQKKRITLVFCKLTDYTNTMCACLRTEVEPFGSGLFLEYNVSADMTAFLTTSIHTTTAHTAAHGGSAKGTEKPYHLTPATWVMDGLWGPEEKAEMMTFTGYRGGDLHPLLDLLIDGPDTKKRDVTCRMTINPVEKGECGSPFTLKSSSISGKQT